MKHAGHKACLLLGSNIEPEKNISRALRRLRRIFPIEDISTVWETPPVGGEGPNFLNVVVMINTALDAGRLKERVLRPMEIQLGRVRSRDKYAPRTIDIDIIAWDAGILDRNVWEYAYLAVPLSEVLAYQRHPETGEYLEQVAQRLMQSSPIEMRPEVLAGFRKQPKSKQKTPVPLWINSITPA
jgi:2-amino-4-hydroxy-6-hydroxymethyldihydropteridine diphosphokinase